MTSTAGDPRVNATAYLTTTEDVYRDAALTPQVGLCCTTSPVWKVVPMPWPVK